MVTSAPAKIIDRKLTMHGYFLNEGTSLALGKYLNNITNPLKQLIELNLDNNGLRDKAAALLF